VIVVGVAGIQAKTPPLPLQEYIFDFVTTDIVVLEKTREDIVPL
jgi:hypothetical protein